MNPPVDQIVFRRAASTVALCLLLVLPLACYADKPAEFDAARLQQDPFSEEFHKTSAAADAGDVSAKIALGEMYFEARGTERNLTAAGKLYQEAAIAGDSRAAFLLAQLIEARDSAAKVRVQLSVEADSFDNRLASEIGEDPMPWLRRAAEAGYAEAQVALAYKHPDGSSDALMWMRRAADQSNPLGEALLGLNLTSDPDPDIHRQGLDLLTRAAVKLPNAGAMLVFAKFQDARKQTGGTTGELSSSDKDLLFNQDLEEISNKSPPDAPAMATMPFMMMMASTDKGARPGDYSGVPAELERRARNGDNESACNLAFLSLKPFFVDWHSEAKPNYADAKIWYDKAAQQGAMRAEYWLGKFYRDGLGVPPDRGLAAKYFYQSAVQDYVPAQAALGDLLMNDPASKVNPAVALAWLRVAAARLNPLAQFDLGRMYYEGIGVTQDTRRGLFLIRLAASNDFGRAAQEWLKQRASDGPDFDVPRHLSWRPNLDSGEGSCLQASKTHL